MNLGELAFAIYLILNLYNISYLIRLVTKCTILIKLLNLAGMQVRWSGGTAPRHRVL